MGTKCSPPTFANVFMSEFEKLFIYPKIKHKSQLYLRYIDDIFLLWTATEGELKVFEEIKKVHPQIKFDINYSYKQINFFRYNSHHRKKFISDVGVHKTNGQALIPTSKILPSKINKKRDSIQSSSTDKANMQQR